MAWCAARPACVEGADRPGEGAQRDMFGEMGTPSEGLHVEAKN
jgi:hypothetical protein